MTDPTPRHPLEENKRRSHPLYDVPKSKPDAAQSGGVRVMFQFPAALARPYLTYGLILINVLVFALRYFAPDFAMQMLLWGVSDTQAVLNNGEWYRLLTSMFLHFNETHLLFNGLALYYIGANVERTFGPLRYLIVYLLGGLAGSVLSVFFSGGGLGASGAVFAVWGAEAVHLWQHQHVYGSYARQRLQSSVVLMAINFFAGLTANSLANIAGTNVRIGNWAHFGGLLGGVLLALLIGPHLQMHRRLAAAARPQSGEASEQGQPPPIMVELKDLAPLNQQVLKLALYIIGLCGVFAAALLLNTG